MDLEQVKKIKEELVAKWESMTDEQKYSDYPDAKYGPVKSERSNQEGNSIPAYKSRCAVCKRIVLLLHAVLPSFTCKCGALNKMDAI